MEIIASDLKKSLDSLKSVITSKGSVENCDKYLFFEDMICAFNGDIFCSVPFETGITGGIPAIAFHKLVESHNTNTIMIEVVDENLIVKKGRSKSTFPLDPEIKKPIKLIKKGWKDLPKNFLEGVINCGKITGNDFTDMRTVCIHVKDKFVEASDNFRISLFKMESSLKDELFIPNDILPFFSKVNIVKYFQDENWVYYLDLEKRVTCHRKITFAEEYPNLTEIVSSLEDYQELKFPESLYDSISKAALFSDGVLYSDKFINIACNKGKLKISSEGANGGYSESINVPFEEKISFDIHPDYLLEAIEKSSSININEATIRIKSKNSTHVASLTIDEGKDGE